MARLCVAGATVLVLADVYRECSRRWPNPSSIRPLRRAGQNAIVHVKITGHETGRGGYVSDWTEESWTLSSPPYTRREIQAFDGSPVVETVQNSEGLSQAYVAGTNTIYQPHQAVGFRAEGAQTDPYRDMILELLTSGGAVAEGTETIDGRECVVIAATEDYGTAADGTPYGTWYVVDAKTYNPVEWRMTRDGGKAVTFHFDVYEQLTADDQGLALLDLAVQHPTAAFSTSLEDYQEAMGIPNPEPGATKDSGR
jgi:hypothetical protein